MALILCIETATKTCSAALINNREVIAEKHLTADNYSHAENLHPFINQLLSENNFAPKSLSAIAVSAGPGSYTGLRIGLSAAKGLCYALDIPLIAIDTLQIMCYAPELRNMALDILCPMIDARRDEVYTASFQTNCTPIDEVKPKILDENSYADELQHQKIAFFGDGSEKFKKMINHPNAVFVNGINPLASQMAALAQDYFDAQKFEDVAYFEPLYLKEFVAGKAKKMI